MQMRDQIDNPFWNHYEVRRAMELVQLQSLRTVDDALRTLAKFKLIYKLRGGYTDMPGFTKECLARVRELHGSITAEDLRDRFKLAEKNAGQM
jgi:hypothetical protein